MLGEASPLAPSCCHSSTARAISQAFQRMIIATTNLAELLNPGEVQDTGTTRF
jgi:hypothetical protein